MIEEIRRWLLIVFWGIIWLHLFCVAKFKRISKHLSFLFNQIQQVTHNFPLSFKIASRINTHQMNSSRSLKKGEVDIPPRTHWWALSLRKRGTSPYTVSYTLANNTLAKDREHDHERSSSRDRVVFGWTMVGWGLDSTPSIFVLLLFCSPLSVEILWTSSRFGRDRVFVDACLCWFDWRRWGDWVNGLVWGWVGGISHECDWLN